MNPIRIERQRVCEQVKSLLGVPVSVVGRDEPLVSPPEPDPGPVHGGVGPLVGEALICPGGDSTAGKRDLRDPEIPLDLGKPRHQPGGQRLGHLVRPGV